MSLRERGIEGDVGALDDAVPPAADDSTPLVIVVANYGAGTYARCTCAQIATHRIADTL